MAPNGSIGKNPIDKVILTSSLVEGIDDLLIILNLHCITGLATVNPQEAGQRQDDTFRKPTPLLYVCRNQWEKA